MSVKGKHYHIATGHESIHKGKYYLCSNNRQDAVEGCCLEPAFRYHTRRGALRIES